MMTWRTPLEPVPAEERAPLDQGGGRAITWFLIVMALVLSVSFFYFTRHTHADHAADSLAEAAASADSAAIAVGDAARNAAGALPLNR
jgi:uncharacterized protein HemX